MASSASGAGVSAGTDDSKQIQDKVLGYWFEGFELGKPQPAAAAGRWFGKSAETDEFIRTEFGSWVEAAAEGKLDYMTSTPEGSAAVIILLDQFTRNMYRDSAKMYDADPKALELALRSIDSGLVNRLPVYMRSFVLMPLMHDERLEIQERCIAEFKAQLAILKPEEEAFRKPLEMNVQFSVKHRDVVAKFGRFPHRNVLLGRESTEEELKHLAEEGGF